MIARTAIQRRIDLLPGFDRRVYESKLDEQLAKIGQSPRGVSIERRSCSIDEDYFLTRHFHIEELPGHDHPEHTGRVVRLLPNHIQNLLADRAARMNVIVKARKPGISTRIDARILWRAMFTPNTHAVIVSHDREHTAAFVDRIKFAVASMVPWMRPRMQTESKNEIVFAHNGSRIRALTAGNIRIGRGSDIDILHLSEAAFYQDLRAIVRGAGEALRPRGEVWWESTPNGHNEFRELYVAARDGRIPGALAHFFSWRLDERNTASPGTPADEHTEEEISMGLTPGQVAWRRAKMSALGEMFYQEYPEDDESCFIYSGSPLFNLEFFRSALGRLEGADGPALAAAPLELADQRLTVWELPYPDHVYVAGADVAEGLPPRGDYSHVGILDVTDFANRRQVAEWHGWMSPGNFGLLCARLAAWYNRALLAIERNNHGHAAIRAARIEAGYWPMYRHSDVMDRTSNAVGQPGRLGFPTTPGTRLALLDRWARACYSGEHVIRSKRVCREAISFQAGDEDSEGLDRKNDSVFGWAIADWAGTKGSARRIAQLIAARTDHLTTD